MWSRLPYSLSKYTIDVYVQATLSQLDWDTYEALLHCSISLVHAQLQKLYVQLIR